MVHLHKKLQKIKHHILRKKHHYGIGALSLFTCLVFVVGVFIITRGTNPSVSELAFIEKSSSGIGSVVPASCDSATPFTSPTSKGGTAGSHTNGDCQTACPGGSGMYDPYFDPAGTACTATPASTCSNGATDYPTCTPSAGPTTPSCSNGATDYPTCTPSTAPSCSNGAVNYPTCTFPVVPAPTVTASVSPTTIPYGGSYDVLEFSSTNAVSCTVNGASGFGTANTWGRSDPQYVSVDWVFVCKNATGVETAPVTVTLTVSGPPTVTATISPTTYVNYGSSFDSLSYTSSNTTWCDKFDDGIRDTTWNWLLLSHIWTTHPQFFGSKTWTFNCYNNWPPGSITGNNEGKSRFAYMVQKLINTVRAAPPFGTDSVTLKVCPRGYLTTGSSCVNERPSITISTPAIVSSPINLPYTFSSDLSDVSSDTVIHNFEWQKPNGEYNWQGTDPGGTITYTGTTEFPDGTGSNALQAVFTPTMQGPYQVRFAGRDNTFSNFNGEGPRWTYSPWTQLNSIKGVTAIIYQNPVDSTRLKWECFNSTRATLSTTNGPGSNDFSNKIVPPTSGSITPSPGATYTLTCINTSSEESKTFVYTMPTLSSSDVGVTTATISWNCNNPSAESIRLERFPGGNITLDNPTGSRDQTDLTGSTEYFYTLRCFNGPDGSGSQIGTADTSFFTQQEGPLANLRLGAYIYAKPTETKTYLDTQPIEAFTGDGTFDSWSYKIWGGAAVSCVMSQRNDRGAWYPEPPYASDPSLYIFDWDTLSTAEKAAFAASFSDRHDWKVTCFDAQNNPATLIWSLLKSNTFPTVIDASLNLDCDSVPPYPTIAVQCVNSDWYEVKNGAGAVFSSGVGPAATVSLLGEDVYKINCYQGGTSGIKSRDVFRAYSASMCTTRPTELIASPTTIRSGGVTTLTWDISQPSSSCSITATPVCSGTCSQGRIDEAAAVNQQFLTGQTDANDPFSLPGIPRTVLQSIQQDAFNNGVSGKALGKKTLRLKYTTDVTIKCTGGPSGAGGGGGAGAGGGSVTGPDGILKVRILVSNENEG